MTIIMILYRIQIIHVFVHKSLDHISSMTPMNTFGYFVSTDKPRIGVPSKYIIIIFHFENVTFFHDKLGSDRLIFLVSGMYFWTSHRLSSYQVPELVPDIVSILKSDDEEMKKWSLDMNSDWFDS